MTTEEIAPYLNTNCEVTVTGNVAGPRTGILKFAADDGASVYELTTPSGERIGNVIFGGDISAITSVE